MNTVNQLANPETKRGPLPRLDWLKRPDLGNVAKFAGTIGVAVAFAASFAGASKASGKESSGILPVGLGGSTEAYIESAQGISLDATDPEEVRFVYAQPADTNLNCAAGQADVRNRISREQNYMAAQDPGLALTVAEAGGMPIVDCLTLKEKGSEIASTTTFRDSVTNQVHALLADGSPRIVSVFLDGVKPTGCGPGHWFLGVNNGNNVATTYLKCDNGTFKIPGGVMSQAEVRNLRTIFSVNGIVPPCAKTYASAPGISGLSSISTDLMAIQGETDPLNWQYWKTGITVGPEGYFRNETNGTCRDLSRLKIVNFVGKAGIAGTGKGSVTPSVSSIAGGRYKGGTKVIYTAEASGGSTFAGWGGDCSSNTANTCELLYDRSHNLSANFNSSTPPPPPPKEVYTVDAKVTKGAILGSLVFNGKKSDHIVYKSTKKGQIVVIKLVPDKKDAYLKSERGCENDQLKKKLSLLIGKCYLKLDEQIERVNLTFAYKAPVIK